MSTDCIPLGRLPRRRSATSRHAWDAPAVRRSVPRIRSAVAAALGDEGLLGGSLSDVLMLAVSELAANVVMHASGTERLRVHLKLTSDRVQLAVVDDDPRYPAMGGDSDHDQESGRGLHLLRALAGEEGGTIVCAPRGTGGKRMILTLPRRPTPQMASWSVGASIRV